MSGQNLPNGQVGPGYSFHFYRPQIRPNMSVPHSSTSRTLPTNRNNTAYTTNPPNILPAVDPPLSSRGTNLLDKSSASPSNIPNVTVISSAALPLANSNFQSLNTLFQSLLRGQVPSSCSIPTLPPSANVTGYLNSVAAVAAAVAGSTGDTTTTTTTVGANYKPTASLSPAISSHHSPAPNSSRHSAPPTRLPIPPTMLNSVPYNGSSNRNRESQFHHPSSSTHSRQQQQQQQQPQTLVPSVSTASGMNPLDVLFNHNNLSTVSVGGKNQTKLDSMTYIRWASSYAISFRRDRVSTWPHSQPDADALQGLNWVIAPAGLLGIYSESPFLRPVILLRRVQYATPTTMVTNYPDPDNMVRTLREMADLKISKHPAFAASIQPRSAASLGFATDYMCYICTVDLDRAVVRLLCEQLCLQNAKPRMTPEYRVILRLGWSTSDFYVPSFTADNRSRQRRALLPESLPRCLSIRVAGRPVSLPDPIFHGGQAQRLGKRLRLSIDITDKLPIRVGQPVRNKFVDVEVTWLHVPLEDQSVKLLDLMAGGSLNPLLCHLIGLPLIQVTLDRVYSITDLCTTFKPNSNPILDLPVVERPYARDLFPLMFSPNGAMLDASYGVHGLYDNCLPATKLITASSTKSSLRSKFQTAVDDDLCITDGTTDSTDYIPVCLLCPLTRTRIELPVRSMYCAHLQCFDLSSYLTINRRRPRWSCPICSCAAPYRDLRLDELFLSILEDPRSSSATFIHVDCDGQWRQAPEELPESQSENTSPAKRPTVKPAQKPVPNGPNFSPVSPPLTSVPTSIITTTCTSAALPNAANCVASDDSENNVELIVLSDDDDDATGMIESVSSKNKDHILISPSKRDTSEPPTPIPPIPNARPLSRPISEPGSVEIDLTNDDEEEEAGEDDVDGDSTTQDSASNAVRPVTPNTPSNLDAPVLSSYSSSTVAPSTPTIVSTRKVLEEDILRKGRPLIVISPLPVNMNGGLSLTLTPINATDSPQTAPRDSPKATSAIIKTTSFETGTTSTIVPSTAYRHLFDTFSVTKSISTTSKNGSSSSSRTTPTTVVSSGGSTAMSLKAATNSALWKRKGATSGHGADADSRKIIRPVASYLVEQPSDPNECVPGLDLSDLSDNENDFVATSNPVFPGPSTSTRKRPPLLKPNQSAALVRLSQQRSIHPTMPQTSSSSSNPTASNISQINQSSSSTNRKRTKSTSRNSKKRRRHPISEEETDISEEEELASSEMSCISESDAEYSADSTPEESEESPLSDSSDDRWSPSRENRVNTVRRGKRRILNRRW